MPLPHTLGVSDDDVDDDGGGDVLEEDDSGDPDDELALLGLLDDALEHVISVDTRLLVLFA
jgi:hypothetical protein